MPETPAGEERAQLRDDIEVLRIMVDAARHDGGDRRLLAACESILQERQARLERIDVGSSRRAA